MKSQGLTKTGLDRLNRVLCGYVERKEVPGLVALVSHVDQVHIEGLGTMSVGEDALMKRDTLFRIASLTKPITAVAAMILVEECQLRLDESIETWMPELANRRVLKSLASELDDTVPAARPITLRDLLTSRMGIGSVLAPPDTYPIQKRIREDHIGGDRPPLPTLISGTDEWLQKLGALPLIAQPGERWMYHISQDVLGVLISRVSGQSLGDFMRERIFEPLGMEDTAFHVPEQNRDRLPTCYNFNRETQELHVYDDAQNSAWHAEPAFESGGGGLVATIEDYFAFTLMMLNNGWHGRKQILSRASIQLMRSDQLTPEQRAGSEVFFGRHGSWGFGVGVDIFRDDIFRTPGRFGWDGGLGTSAYIDPAEGMIGILMTQSLLHSPTPPKIFTDFWTLAYGAME
ncbi:serine hydrolase domain-containing protein [Schlesneria sp. T3-172]|uniref:serine hydrolase domain-containing protein n=1 Tax=Schlesneria sphaerica TaxID=3373610 RepID=UPI0037C682E3